MEQDQAFYESVQNLLRQVNLTLKDIKFDHPRYAALNVAAADVEEYFQNNDPRDMGWVGHDGLP